jgi:hypothetical protein
MGRSLRTILNESNPNKLPSATQAARLGSALALLPRCVKSAVTSHQIVLPDNAKAVAVLRAFSAAGTVTGNLVPVTTAAPTTGQVGVGTDGDLVFAAADAVTQAEVVYVQVEGDVVEETVPVVSNVASLTAGRKGILLISATATAGTSLGAKGILARGTAATAGNAALNLLGTGVAFFGADAVTQATIKYIATPGEGSAKDAIGTNLDDTSFQF